MAGASFAEVRLDRVRLSLEEVSSLFSLPKRLIATCRPGRFSESAREERLRRAIAAGASYVDIELDAPSAMRQRTIREARRRGCKVILSFHDFRSTPSSTILSRKVTSCFTRGADIAKIACAVRSDSDVRRIFSLYDLKLKGEASLLALGLGKKGTITRIAAPFLGAPFTFAAPDGGRPTAAGQLEKKDMERILGLLGRRIG